MTRIGANPKKRRGRRRISVGLLESKTLKLYQEARRLLARSDFEDISIAQFAKTAETSVGAFYVRFADKDEFLSFVTSHTFTSARRPVEKMMSAIASNSHPAEGITEAIISQWAGKEFAGVVRMAVKRGCSDIKHRQPFDRYREYVVDEVVGLIPDEAKKEDRTRVEVAVQVTLGILTDAIMSKPHGEPLKLSEYHEAIASLLNNALGKVKLEKPKAKEPTEETGVKKI